MTAEEKDETQENGGEEEEGGGENEKENSESVTTTTDGDESDEGSENEKEEEEEKGSNQEEGEEDYKSVEEHSSEGGEDDDESSSSSSTESGDQPNQEDDENMLRKKRREQQQQQQLKLPLGNSPAAASSSPAMKPFPFSLKIALPGTATSSPSPAAIIQKKAVLPLSISSTPATAPVSTPSIVSPSPALSSINTMIVPEVITHLLLDEVVNVKGMEGYPVDARQLAVLYKVDEEKNGTFTLNNLVNFAEWCRLITRLSLPAEFQSTVQAQCIISLWKSLTSEHGKKQFVEWFYKLFVENMPVQFFDEHDDVVFLRSDNVKTLHDLLNIKESYGIDFQTFFDVMQRVGEEMVCFLFFFNSFFNLFFISSFC